MSDRFQSFERFWPYYLGEHRHPSCRRLHFVGTTLFFGLLVAALALHPLELGLAGLGIFALGWVGSVWMEPRGQGHWMMLGIVVLGISAVPWLVTGVLVAYACAWVGHFLIEHNRPATFKYPLWSLLGDFRMWGHMARGRLWSGDPLAELNLRAPAAPGQASPAGPEA